jgi:hypothetical protein
MHTCRAGNWLLHGRSFRQQLWEHGQGSACIMPGGSWVHFLHLNEGSSMIMCMHVDTAMMVMPLGPPACAGDLQSLKYVWTLQ